MEQQNNSGNNGLVRFLLGLFTGAAVAAPVTGLIVKKICDRQKDEAVTKALDAGQNQGIQAMKEVYQEEMAKNGGQTAEIPVYSEPVTAEKAENNPNARYLTGNEVAAEAYRASLQHPMDDGEEKMDGSLPTDEDIENYDLSIDDEEATEGAREFSEEHVQYLDMVNRYKNSGGHIPPMTISREEFENTHIYEKSYVNWYDEDDVFEENNHSIDDPNYHFGFISGKDMFAPSRTAQREDPDICHVRNVNETTDYEITRVHGSYSRMVEDGEAYYNGEANSQY